METGVGFNDSCGSQLRRFCDSTVIAGFLPECSTQLWFDRQSWQELVD